ncbi:MAG: hypothetical protein R3F11_11775 [Verrucomicrobiales bacterium]
MILDSGGSRDWAGHRVFSAKAKIGGYPIHAAACDSASAIESSWVNGVHTVGAGSHIDGFKEALISAEWNPRILLIQIVMRDPRFAAPTKDKLVDPEARTAVRDALMPLLAQFMRD